jgi:hypothetical protein
MAPETKPDGYPDEEDEDSLLKEASRLAHSVRPAHLSDICCVNDSSQAFGEGGIETEADLSASTARPKWGKCIVVPKPGTSNQRNQRQVHRPAVSEEAPQDEGESEAPSRGPSKASEVPDDDDVGMSDHTSNSNRGDTPHAARLQEGGEVRTPKRIPPHSNVYSRVVT